MKQQLHELHENFKHAFLFVEDYDGITDCIASNPQLHPNVIVGIVSSSFGHNRVPICFVGDFYVPVVLHMIEKFYDGKYEEYKNEVYSPLRQGFIPSKKKSTKKDFQKYIVMGLPDIGATERDRILQHFNYSLKRIVNADYKEFMEIEGIGEKKAKAIWEIWQ